MKIRTLFIYSILSTLSHNLMAQAVVNVVAKPQAGGTSVITDAPSFSFTEPFKLVVDVSGIPSRLLWFTCKWW